MQQYALDYDYGLLNNNNGASGYRDYNRVNWRGLSYGNGLALEHTMYTSGENIEKYITNNNVDMNRTYNSTFFNFVDYRQDNPVRDLTQSQDSQLTTKDGPVVKDGEYVEISHSQSYKTRFLYDTTNNVYLMQQNFSGNWRDTIDEEYNDYQLQFPNVIVLFTDIHTYPGHETTDLQYVEYSWGGIGYYFYGGKCEKIYWQKGTPLEALRLYYLNENGQCSDTPCEINIGKSYVTIVDVDEAINLKVGNLADFDLDAATVSASNTSIDADAKAGETLGASTTDLVSAARNNQAVGNTESNTQSTTQSSTTTNTSNDSQSVESAPQQDNTPQQDTADQSSADDTASDDSGEDIPWAD